MNKILRVDHDKNTKIKRKVLYKHYRIRFKKIVGTTHINRAPPTFTPCSRLPVQKDTLFKTLNS